MGDAVYESLRALITGPDSPRSKAARVWDFQLLCPASRGYTRLSSPGKGGGNDKKIRAALHLSYTVACTT